MIRIVVGGQINKQEIAAFTKNFMGSNATVDVKNDLDATMAIQAGQYDYYIGACNTGGGGALAMAMALLGTPSLAVYLPVMIAISIITGLFTGLCAQFLVNRGNLWKIISK